MPAPSPAPSPIPVTSVLFTDTKSVYTHCSWLNGIGDNRIVVISERDDLTVPSDGSTWSFNAKYGNIVYSENSESGSPLSWVVYKGNDENVTVYNLKAKTKYYFYFFEYDIINDATFYMQYFTISSITTAANESTTSIKVIVTDDLTKIAIKDADITINNRNSNIISKDRTNDNGYYITTPLPVGGIYLTITAPGYNVVSLKSVFIKDTNNKSSYKSQTTQVYNIRLLKTVVLL